ncbi:hypothetical protein EVAR_59035_1 [Eumeta japonica]|uniref:Uncharacterized protein n=1 Tax=Eumeta variegata TaxID=151549 RepID=A0A4C1ZAL5_EUMVA|nr:hypothetical protein EVAR_59035_1 [Eumeta japonica]
MYTGDYRSPLVMKLSKIVKRPLRVFHKLISSRQSADHRRRQALQLNNKRSHRGDRAAFAPPSFKWPVAQAKLKARRGAESGAETGSKIENVTRVKLECGMGLESIA